MKKRIAKKILQDTPFSEHCWYNCRYTDHQRWIAVRVAQKSWNSHIKSRDLNLYSKWDPRRGQSWRQQQRLSRTFDIPF